MIAADSANHAATLREQTLRQRRRPLRFHSVNMTNFLFDLVSNLVLLAIVLSACRLCNRLVPGAALNGAHIFVALVSAATPLASETVRDKWFSFPNIIFLSPLPISTFLAGFFLWKNLGRSDWKPFACAVAIYALAFAGLAYSLFPYVVMDRLTIWEAAAHPSALWVMLIGVLLVLPFLAGYTIYAYRVFHGKARPGLYE